MECLELCALASTLLLTPVFWLRTLNIHWWNYHPCAQPTSNSLCYLVLLNGTKCLVFVLLLQIPHFEDSYYAAFQSVMSWHHELQHKHACYTPNAVVSFAIPLPRVKPPRLFKDLIRTCSVTKSAYNPAQRLLLLQTA